MESDELKYAKVLLSSFDSRIRQVLQEERGNSDSYDRAVLNLAYADSEDAKIGSISVRNVGKKPNFIFGDPAAEKSGRLEIRFFGQDCVVYVGPQCRVSGLVRAHANRTLTWLGGQNGQPSVFNITHWSASTLVYLSPRVTSNGTQIVTMGEGAGVFVGEDTMFSTGIWLKTSDMHAIVDLTTGEMINRYHNKGDIVLGDHVWVGQDCLVTHAVRIGRGAIIGAKSFVNKDVRPKTLNVGTPSREIRENVSWLRSHQVAEPQLSEMQKLVLRRSDT